MHFDDLAPYGLLAEFAPGSERVKAVGWLENGCAYSTGAVEPRAIARLFDIAEHPQWTTGELGYHACDLCPDAPERTGTLAAWRQQGILGTWRTRTAEVGGSELCIPGHGCVYIAPSMILHYILAHDYAPPPEFINALLSCPPAGTSEYLAAFKNNGGAAYLR